MEIMNLAEILRHLTTGYDLSTPTDDEILSSWNAEPGNLTGYDCRECLNRGYIFDLRDGERVTTECKCMSIRRAQQRMARSGLSGLLDRYTFQTFEAVEEWQKTALDVAQAFYRDDACWFYMAGQPGCGKTHLCTALVGKMIQAGCDTRYMRWVEDSASIRFAPYDAREKRVEQYQRCELLYIDDFLKTQQGEAPDRKDIQLAFEIINHRYVNRLRTIVSSERTPADVMYLDEALGSRLYERAKHTTVCVERKQGRNWRLQNAVK